MPMGCPGMFMVEPSTRMSRALPFVPMQIIDIIMILSSQGNHPEILTPHLILRMDLNILPTVSPYSTRRLTPFLKEMYRISPAMT